MEAGIIGLQAVQPLHHLLGDVDLVGGGLLGDLEHHAGGLAGLCHGVHVLVLQGDVGYFAQTHRAAGGEGEDHVPHVVHRLELGVGGDGQLLGPVFQAPAGVDEVLTRQELGHVGGAQAIARRPGGVQLHGDLLLHAAVHRHLGHAVDALQGGDHQVLRQGLELAQVLAHQGDHGRGHQGAEVHVDDDRVHGVLREAHHVELLPELRGGDVQVRAVHVSNLNLAHAVGGGGGNRVHAGDGHDGSLQGPGDQLLNVAGAGPGVVAGHHGHGHLHLRHQGHLELRGEHQAEDADQDAGQDGRHLVLDACSGDTHVIPPRTLRPQGRRLHRLPAYPPPGLPPERPRRRRCGPGRRRSGRPGPR